MKFSHLLLFAAGVPLLAFAQPDRVMPAVADANAAVTPLHYESVFADYIAVKEAPQSPDKGWARANRALLGNEDKVPASDGQPAAGASDRMATPAHPQNKHEHKGTHQ
jgi:hypothetical protein